RENESWHTAGPAHPGSQTTGAIGGRPATPRRAASTTPARLDGRVVIAPRGRDHGGRSKPPRRPPTDRGTRAESGPTSCRLAGAAGGLAEWHFGRRDVVRRRG